MTELERQLLYDILAVNGTGCSSCIDPFADDKTTSVRLLRALRKTWVVRWKADRCPQCGAPGGAMRNWRYIYRITRKAAETTKSYMD